LADWIARPENPLTARVYVNRVWSWLFGEGLVRTLDNFGTTGESPSHPELLDYLADRFIARGWRTKPLIRELVLSRVYQLSSQKESPVGAALRPDDGNRLVSRANRRRLHAEQLRDAMLVISGRLLPGGNGPGFPPERTADYGFVFDQPRRSVYVPVFRNALPEFLSLFDFPSPSMVSGKRDVSTVPTQALFLLNHPFVREQAEAAARGLLATESSQDGRLAWAYQAVLGRLPTPPEREHSREYLARAAADEPAQEQVWADLFHALMASADFRDLD
jgi:hypothetical protein